MARPKKQTVDYFPHYCDESRSLQIVQTKHGNDGYAFWFKMLQLLGKTDGHVYDYNNPDDWLFLLTETHAPDERKAENLLELFALLGMIDEELWKKKIIWCQHFVDNVADAYKRRTVELPVRPGFPLPEVNQALIQAVDIFDKLGGKIAGMIKCYEEEIGKPLSTMDYEKLKDFADTYPDDYFEQAVGEAKKNKAKAPMSYIESIMESWLKDGKVTIGKANRKGSKLPAEGGYTSPEDA